MCRQTVKAIREGQDVSSVAAAYGINVRSVFRWLADFANGGQNALLAKPILGRPPKVSEEEMRWLAGAVRDNTPLQYKFAFRFMLHDGSVNAEAFKEFLKRLLVGATGPVFLVLDGHPIHKGN